MRLKAKHPRFVYLDFLRYMCASIVVLCHCVEMFLVRIYGKNSSIDYFQSWCSDMAVITFFILSGYVIAYTIDLQKMQKTYSFYEYVKKRFIRIYPVAWGAILLACLTILFMYLFKLGGLGEKGFYLPGDLYSEPNYISYFTFFNTLFLVPDAIDGGFFNGALWSLPYEFCLYMIYGFIVKLIIRLGYKVAIFWIAFLTLYIIMWYGFNSGIKPYFGVDFFSALKNFPTFDFICLSATWFLGVALFYLTKNNTFQIKIFLLLVLIAVITTYIMNKTAGVEWLFRMYPKTWMQTIMLWGYSILVASGIYVLIFLKNPNQMTKVIANLGQKYSFSLYATHFVVLHLFFALFMPYIPGFNPLKYVILILACFITANFVAYYFSKIFENKKLWTKILLHIQD